MLKVDLMLTLANRSLLLAKGTKLAVNKSDEFRHQTFNETRAAKYKISVELRIIFDMRKRTKTTVMGDMNFK
jgi:hypothetical protein